MLMLNPYTLTMLMFNSGTLIMLMLNPDTLTKCLSFEILRIGVKLEVFASNSPSLVKSDNFH